MSSLCKNDTLKFGETGIKRNSDPNKTIFFFLNELGIYEILPI